MSCILVPDILFPCVGSDMSPISYPGEQISRKDLKSVLKAYKEDVSFLICRCPTLPYHPQLTLRAVASVS